MDVLLNDSEGWCMRRNRERREQFCTVYFNMIITCLERCCIMYDFLERHLVRRDF